MSSMLGMLPGSLEIWIQLQGVWEMVDCTLSKTSDHVLNRESVSVPMNPGYLRSDMRLEGVCSMLEMLPGSLEIWIQVQGV